MGSSPFCGPALLGNTGRDGRSRPGARGNGHDDRDVHLPVDDVHLYLAFIYYYHFAIGEHSFWDGIVVAPASLALLVTALNALIPAAAVYTLLPLVWAVGSGFAFSGWLACEEERVESSCERFFGLALTVVRSVVTLPLAVLPWVEAMPGGLFDALWFACTAMALLHLSMAFWLSGGKPHIVVAWVGSAVMGLALSLPPLFPQSNTSLRSHQAFLVFLGVSLGLALVFVLIFFLKKFLLALPGPELPTETGSDDQGASQPFDHSSNVLPPEQPLPPPVIGILVDNRVTAAVNARVSYCCPCPCWPAADADAIEDNMTA